MLLWRVMTSYSNTTCIPCLLCLSTQTQGHIKVNQFTNGQLPIYIIGSIHGVIMPMSYLNILFVSYTNIIWNFTHPPHHKYILQLKNSKASFALIVNQCHCLYMGWWLNKKFLFCEARFGDHFSIGCFIFIMNIIALI